MDILKNACVIALVMSIAACVSNAAQRTEANAADFQALPPQPLESGQCGLFLWSQTPGAKPTLVLAAFDKPAEARVLIGTRRVTLARRTVDGEMNHGHFASQTFSDGRVTLSVDLEFDSARPVQDGAIVGRGTLRLRDEKGWETITPTRGMTACQK